MGETRTSKLMARKRPRLVPVYDSVVGHLMSLDLGSAGQWKRWHTALTDGTGLRSGSRKSAGSHGYGTGPDRREAERVRGTRGRVPART